MDYIKKIPSENKINVIEYLLKNAYSRKQLKCTYRLVDDIQKEHMIKNNLSILIIKPSICREYIIKVWLTKQLYIYDDVKNLFAIKFIRIITQKLRNVTEYYYKN